MSTAIFGLEGKNAIVLGGGQGMGESTSMCLARNGCNVAVMDLDLSRARRVADQVSAEGRRGLAIKVDATNDAELRQAIALADRELGGIDAMATIIGMAGWAPLLEMTTQTWDTDQNRNLRYFFVAAQAAASLMIGRGKGGAIVCITSIDGIRSAPYHASYGAAKAALINLVKSMSIEWAEHGLRVNAIAPGTIITPRLPKGSSAEESLKYGLTPMRRRGTTDDIAKAVLFLLSDLATFVTGQTLVVDGGYTAAAAIDYATVSKNKKGAGATGVTPKK